MKRPEILMARLYRQTHGDVGIKDVPLLAEVEDLEAAASDLLLSYFRDKGRASKPPHHVDVVREDGTIAFSLMVVDEKVQRVPETRAS